MNDTLNHMIDRLKQVDIATDPYPYFFIENFFPSEFYEELLSHLPTSTCYRGMNQTGKVDPRTYQERFVLPLFEGLNHLPFPQFVFWSQFAMLLESEIWVSALKAKFDPWIKKRFENHLDQVQFSSFAELVRDHTHYALGPHTDHPIRVITLLFYFPKDDSMRDLGTSVYRPHQKMRKCEGFVHHPREEFVEIDRAPFMPNSVFGFVKSSSSFHGVEAIDRPHIERNLLNYYLQWQQHPACKAPSQ